MQARPASLLQLSVALFDVCQLWTVDTRVGTVLQATDFDLSGPFDIRECISCPLERFDRCNTEQVHPATMQPKPIAPKPTENLNPISPAGSIADNIAYGRFGRCSPEEIEAAAKAANAHEFIMQLPDG